MTKTGTNRTACSISKLAARYASGALTPTQYVEETLQRIDAVDRPEVWIHRVSAEDLYARAAQLEALQAEAGAALIGHRGDVRKAIGLLLADKTRAQALTGLVLVVLGVPVYYVWRGLAPRTPQAASAGPR